jgi:hypothetical protein
MLLVLGIHDVDYWFFLEHFQSSCTGSLKAKEVERCELWFRLVGEKPLFKLHLQLKPGFGRFFRGACNTIL